ncbi:hypothetical protein RND71_003932 [Anisodus tanguticus]|uniref:Disease resistance protein At4g27190-like leucine-rich repeats domain-containing protein n=1 Tax=Anisodus tanguticus TaxID=243964 RepID=A0AAE1VUH8_9SOLA|nr:hypothetical protein RND71_003932 [Anisodus tanguticus]
MHDVVHDVAISVVFVGKRVFMVSHDVNSKEFPRTSYKQYTHISFVAKRFDELPKAIFCPRLESTYTNIDSAATSRNIVFPVLESLELLSLPNVKETCCYPPPSQFFVKLGRLVVRDLLSLTHLLRICCQNSLPFPKFERLDVRECNRLQYLFRLSLAGSSSKLEDLTVAFPDDDEEEMSQRIHIEPEGKMIQVIKFPNLYEMHIEFLKCLTHFCNDIVEVIEFPQLRIMPLHRLTSVREFLAYTQQKQILHGCKSSF